MSKEHDFLTWENMINELKVSCLFPETMNKEYGNFTEYNLCIESMIFN